MNVKIIDKTERPIETIYRAFRVCYSKDVPTKIEIPKKYQHICSNEIDTEKMIEFIKDKIDLGHGSPLEHCNITFAIEGVSRSLSHQLVRHRIASYSQQSQRYCKLDTKDAGWFVTPKSIEENIELAIKYYSLMGHIASFYEDFIKMGVPKEDARYILPNATTTNLVMTFNLRSFRNFIAERTCKMAQWEIRELANKMLEEVEKIVPFVGYKAKKCGVTCFQCKDGE